MAHRLPRSVILAGLVTMIAGLAACSVCKSTDNAEQCRTKQRDHGQSRAGFSAALIHSDRQRNDADTSCNLVSKDGV